ncbi:MAG: serine/threonine-protein kinase, partial [Angustibacter sp.]
TQHEGAAPAVLRRFQLPTAITDRYDYERDLSSAGAQADVVLCRDRATGEQVAIKIYRPEMTAALERDALASLAGADRAHVVPFRLDSDDHQVWEVQEYFPLGSLEDLVLARGGGAQSEEFCREVLAEVGQSLDHIHSRDIVHRDLKPQNVLIRSTDPLDTVLADFGLARVAAMSRAVRSLAGTAHYTSPEGAVGRGNKANDWWGLGIIVHELLTGRHMFAGPDGQYLSDNEVRAAFFDRSWSYSEVTDERWRLLLDGLLGPGEHRWSWRQVAAWLEGGSPTTVPWPAAASTSNRPTSRPGADRAYHFAGGAHRSPEELAAAFRAHFVLATDLIAGVKVSDLMAWLHGTAVGTSADDLLSAVRAGAATPDRAAVELQLLLDPDATPVYRDRELSAPALQEVIAAARNGDRAAADWITALRTAAVLTVLGRYTDEPRMSHADELLSAWWPTAETLLSRSELLQGPWAPLTPAARPQVEGTLLLAALDDSHQEALLERARSAVEELPADIERAPGRGGVDLLRDGVRTGDLATAAVAAPLLPAWAAQERERVAAARRADEERERQREEREKAEAAALAELEREARRAEQRVTGRRRRGNDFFAAFVAVVLCATVLGPWLVGRYLLRDTLGRDQMGRVFDTHARHAGEYFLSDWSAGCVVVGLLLAVFVLVRPWHHRRVNVALAIALVVGLLAVVVPFSRDHWKTAEMATGERLLSEPFPFSQWFYTCGSDSVEFPNPSGTTTTYALWSAKTQGSSVEGCDRLELYQGWKRVALVTLPASRALSGSGFSSPITASKGRTPGSSTFTVESAKGQKTKYTVSALAKQHAVSGQPTH